MDEEAYYRCECLGWYLLDCFSGGSWKLAKQEWEAADLTNEEQEWMWQHFDSKQKAWLSGADTKGNLEYIEPGLFERMKMERKQIPNKDRPWRKVSK